jgi:hypothetical protein
MRRVIAVMSIAAIASGEPGGGAWCNTCPLACAAAMRPSDALPPMTTGCDMVTRADPEGRRRVAS